MSVTATEVGRSLHLRISNVEEPFVIEPIPGRRGLALVNEFLNITAGRAPALGMQALLEEATGPEVAERIKDELSLREQQDILLPAFYWQTVLGIDGVTGYISGGEGMAGAKKALELLILTLGLSPTPTAPSTALESLTRSLAPTPPTAASTTTVDRLPPAKRSKNQTPKKPKRTR